MAEEGHAMAQQADQELTPEALMRSQHDLYYALEAALRGLRVGYDSRLAATLREQHKLLVTHNVGCDGCASEGERDG